jgi:hypothetical protein
VWECALKGTRKLDDAEVTARLSEWVRNSQDAFYEIRGNEGALRLKSET